MNIVEIEKAILKRYRSRLYRPFVNAIADYNMISPGDIIAVCISGGKDSFVMAKLFQEIAKHGKIDFSLKFIVMNPGYKEEILLRLVENANHLQIPIVIKETDVFRVARKLGGDKPCYMCARMRRGFLYEYARLCGCNKIALGHHFNDVIETTMLNILYGGTFEIMMPKLKAKNFPGMELIRPMIYVKEKDIINFVNYIGINTENGDCGIRDKYLTKREEIKKLILSLKKVNKDIDINIFKSGENINLDRVVKWRHQGRKFSFLEYYDN
ncbi:MAG: tRNA 2-thiocytidine biosynthesis protein TtcA [Bacilli bacterium]|nr:tRNA 2-thiocytidine biosynthesis protein TtcA [Bacilli bacterium]MDD4076949.1 ATP-binding protein [Bacilli bacterium]MDD4387659.1 ATP-binding protein [Bacilli bacterium]